MNNFLRNKRGISTQGMAIVLAIILIGSTMAGLFAYGQGWFSPSTTTTTPETTSTASGLSIFNYGSHAMTVGGLSGLSGVTTTYSEATDFVVQWYSPSAGRVLNPSNNGTGTIDIPKNDGGIIWAVVEPASGYYVDSDSITSKNSYVGAAQYGPVFGSGVNYWYFPYDVNNAVPVYSNGVPTYAFSVYLKPYQAITLANDNSGNITSIGTSSVDKWLYFYSTFSSVNHANAITKIVLTLNTTDTNKVQFLDITVPWQSNTVSSAAFTSGPSLIAGSLGSVDYTWTITSTLQGAKMVDYTANSQTKLPFTIHTTCNLGSGDVIRATLTVTSLTTDGKTTATTSSIIDLQAS
jgi:hypothetical protein